MVCGPRPGKASRIWVMASIDTPGNTWFADAIMVSIEIRAPERTVSTGGSALSNQPHCVVWGVAGNTWMSPSIAPGGTGRLCCSSVFSTSPSQGALATAPDCRKNRLRESSVIGNLSLVDLRFCGRHSCAISHTIRSFFVEPVAVRHNAGATECLHDHLYSRLQQFSVVPQSQPVA